MGSDHTAKYIDKKLLCCAAIDEDETISNNKLKRPEVSGVEFRNPKKKTYDTSGTVNMKTYAKTASLPKPIHENVVDQTFEKMTHLEKLPRLLNISQEGDKPLVVSCNFKSDVDDVWLYLKQRGILVSKLHGSLEQIDRDKALNDFKKKKVKVLVSTAKLILGINVPWKINVVNFDLPHEYCDYKRMLLKADSTITFINEHSPRNSMLELSADEEILVPQFITDINEICGSGIIWSRKPEKELWMM